MPASRPGNEPARLGIDELARAYVESVRAAEAT
jgi:hypothetical protein